MRIASVAPAVSLNFQLGSIGSLGRVSQRTVRILGTHGVPADYGGFETAAVRIAKFLVRKGWRVIVYCQAEDFGPIKEDVWQLFERVTIPVHLRGRRRVPRFDWLSTATLLHIRIALNIAGTANKRISFPSVKL
jgi:hypothetical protein